MTVGLATATANAVLGVFKATTYTGITTVFLKLHTADPGAAGATAASAVTTRNAITWGTIASGSMPLSSVGSFSMTTSETITHISLWDAPTAGNFLQSAQLTASVPVINGSTLTFSSLTLSYSPLAA